MQRCIQLAKNSQGMAAPNPMVGCVIVHQGSIIGEGYTSPFGGPHAEVNAIRSLGDTSLLSKATLYVSLEPCSHYGKTPPCADMILKFNIPDVVIGVRDPNELVAGNGIDRLREAGCRVTEGVLENECRELNQKFFLFHQSKRPFVILKWAQSSDGFLAPEPKFRSGDIQPYWITNTYSRQLVHEWRTQEQAILVGTRTVMEDNPQLNARLWSGNSPIRVILDRELKIPDHFHIMDKSSRTIILTEVTDPGKEIQGVQYNCIDFSANVAEEVCRVLRENNILSVIVEGGAKTLETFITAALWDEARVFTGPTTLVSGIKAPEVEGTIFDQLNINGDHLKLIRRD